MRTITKILIFALLLFCISCRSTEDMIQRKGFRPWPRSYERGYGQTTRNFIGYGTYQRPNRKGVDR